MVRLKGAAISAVYTTFTQFQFQYGAIKSEAPYVKGDGTGVFQFQYGAIKSH